MKQIHGDISEMRIQNHNFESKFNALIQALGEMAENQQRMQTNMLQLQSNMA